MDAIHIRPHHHGIDARRAALHCHPDRALVNHDFGYNVQEQPARFSAFPPKLSPLPSDESVLSPIALRRLSHPALLEHGPGDVQPEQPIRSISPRKQSLERTTLIRRHSDDGARRLSVILEENSPGQPPARSISFDDCLSSTKDSSIDIPVWDVNQLSDQEESASDEDIKLLPEPDPECFVMKRRNSLGRTPVSAVNKGSSHAVHFSPDQSVHKKVHDARVEMHRKISRNRSEATARTATETVSSYCSLDDLLMSPQSAVSYRPQESIARSDNNVSGLNRNDKSDGKRRNLVQIAPGIYKKLRGAIETWTAISTNDFTSATCNHCEEKLYCINDADHVVCPVCCKVSITTHSLTRGQDGGVGLGFTLAELVAWKREINELAHC